MKGDVYNKLLSLYKNLKFAGALSGPKRIHDLVKKYGISCER